ncbi:MAG: hypothetical protein AAFY60_09000, partial [Myxococcota bacterium]
MRVLTASILCFLTTATAHAGFVDHFATRDDVGVDKAPSLGRSRILVVPVIIEEANLPTEQTLLAAMSPFFGDEGVFVEYYDVASLGRFTPQLVLGPSVRFSSCPLARGPSGRCSITRGDLTALPDATQTIRAVLDELDQTVDFRDFDINGARTGEPDGVIDGLIFVSNIDFGGIALPHLRLCELGSTFCDEPSWDPTYDETLVPWVAIAAARGGSVADANYVSIHEFGHLLGFVDLYDESNSSTDLPYSVMGGWNYDAQPDLLAGPSRYLIGWGAPRQASGTNTYLLRPAAQSGDLLKLGTGAEYFIAEMRQASGPFDGSIANPGVALYHVNLERQPPASSDGYLATLLDCVNCDPWDPFIALEQADGQFELESGPGNRDDADDLFRAGDAFPSTPARSPNRAGSAVFDS